MNLEPNRDGRSREERVAEIARLLCGRGPEGGSMAELQRAHELERELLAQREEDADA